MNEDGTMARLPDLETFAEEHDLRLGTIADLVHYRAHDSTVEKVGEKEIETAHGPFQVHAFRDTLHGRVHYWRWRGRVNPAIPPW